MDTESVQFLNNITSIETDNDVIEHLPQLITLACQKGQERQVIAQMQEMINESAIKVEQLCTDNNEAFNESVSSFHTVRDRVNQLQTSILELNNDIQASGRDLQDKKSQLKELHDAENNLNAYKENLVIYLDVFNHIEKAGSYFKEKRYYKALRLLDEISSTRLKRMSEYSLTKALVNSLSSSREYAKSLAMKDLHEWLFNIREKSVIIGSFAFEKMDERRRSWAREFAQDLQNINTRSPYSLHLALLNTVDFSPLNNEAIKITFEPLYTGIHIFSYLGILDEFQLSFEKDRRLQLESLAPKSLNQLDLKIVGNWLKAIAGFMIIEYYVLQRVPGFRTLDEVDFLWSSICDKLSDTLIPLLFQEQSTATIMKIKNLVMLLIHTMEFFNFPVWKLHGLCIKLIDAFGGALIYKHAGMFAETLDNDNYAPLEIKDEQMYCELIQPYWYDKKVDSFPVTMPFSKMCYECCQNADSFIRRFFMFLNDSITLAVEVNERAPRLFRRFIKFGFVNQLTDRLPRLGISQVAQVVQNFDAFEEPLLRMERILSSNKSITPMAQMLPENAQPSSHKATEMLEEISHGRKQALHQIFICINHKIDDFVDLAEYDWITTTPRTTVSGYLQEMLAYLQTMYMEILGGIDNSDKSYIYLETLDHLSTAIMKLITHPSVRRISSTAAAGFKLDIEFLESFAAKLPGQSIVNADSFIELRQSAKLLQAENVEEYMDADKFVRDFSRLDTSTAIKLLEKLLNNYSALPLSNDRPKRKAIEHVLAALRKRLAQEIAQAQAQGPQKSKA
ncbi:exocyst complex subunit Sec15 [Schizosaccharomyces japonicus yFS275]|uniref:Exocyst complex component SEC15 n=1 Tax=Schizosaccharomyces japonicus (strain yFS275 / FY16936) TaxID=402676 RepID=B6K595_SCHJY|nr:exocyst complex subunit Sec15 [Schizosaccharomyces japonicus yFS275]EEB08699.2 exocyst complex subunit Sec15 [Schizosaccharomyces japonicus yFS275]